jgi:hypothetical protein
MSIMAVAQLLTFPGSASAHINNGGGGGEMNLCSNIREQTEGVDKWQNDEELQREFDRVLKILLRKSRTQIKDSRAASTHVDTESSRFKEQSEVRDFVPAVTCEGEGDGGHRCPYFPCPYCHRSRGIFVPESNTPLMTCEGDEVDHQETLLVIGSKVADDSDISNFKGSVNDQSVPDVTYDDEGDGGHRCPYFPCPYCHRSRGIFVPESNTPLMTCDGDEVDHQETLLVIGSKLADDSDISKFKRLMNDHSVPIAIVTCDDEGDGGHRCPYFPCPYCHRSRSIFIPEVGSPTLDRKSILDTTSHVHVDYCPMSRIDDQSGVPFLTCPDKGHVCPYFPCPICHRDR